MTMCCFRERLILSTIAAKVVDLPEPVAPVTRIRPRCSSASFSTPIGRPSFSNDGTSKGTWRKANEMAPRWRKPLTRKRPVFPAVYEMSRSPVSSKTSRFVGRVLGHNREHGFEVAVVQRLLAECDQRAVNARHRRRVDLEVQVAPPVLDGRGEKGVQIHGLIGYRPRVAAP